MQRCREECARDSGHNQIEGWAEDRTRAAQPAGTHGQEDDEEHGQARPEQEQRLGVAGIDGACDEDGQQNDVADSVRCSSQEDRRGKDPAGPRHHRHHRVAEPRHHGSAQLEDRRGERGGDHTEVEDPAQHVGAAASDEDGRHDDDGECPLQREHIGDQGRNAENGRLPIESQRNAHPVVGIPQRDVAGVHLEPGQVRPGDHRGDLVAECRVVRYHAALRGEAQCRKCVKWTEVPSSGERWCEHQHRRRHHPTEAQHIRQTPEQRCCVLGRRHSV